MDGRRQPFRPPTALSAQAKRPPDQVLVVVAGDCSQTSPVSLSNTAAPPMTHFHRLEVPRGQGTTLGRMGSGGSTLSQACGSPLWSAPVERLSIFWDKAL